METAKNTQAAQQSKKVDSATIKPTDLLVKQPVNPIADKALQAAVDTVTGANMADEVGTDIGVEDEISYVVAEGTANAELASAAGLFGGIAGAGLGPGALALAGLGLLAGGGGGGGENGPPPGNTTATGVVGATEAAAEGTNGAGIPGVGTVIAGDPNNPNDGASGSIDSGSEMLTGNLPGAAGAGSEAVIGNTDSAADANGNAVAPDQNFGIIGGMEAGGLPADAQTPVVAIRDGISGSPIAGAPGGDSIVEGTNDALGSSTSNPVGATTAQSAGNDLPVQDIIATGTSAITSTADTLSSGQLPFPPAV